MRTRPYVFLLGPQLPELFLVEILLQVAEDEVDARLDALARVTSAQNLAKSRAKGPLSGNYLDYDNIDEKLCEINIWLKYIKFGFWRATDQVCYDIWNNKLSREEAVEIVNDLQDQFPEEYFEDFLRFHSISEKEFWDTVEKFRNLDVWHKRNGKWSIKKKLV